MCCLRLVFLTDLCLNYLSMDASGVLKYPTIIALLSTSSYMFVHICFMPLHVAMLGDNIFTIVIPYWWFNSLIIL